VRHSWSTSNHFLLDRVGLAADLGREIAAPAAIEHGDLGEPRGLASR
jgi:hypothetical protein